MVIGTTYAFGAVATSASYELQRNVMAGSKFSTSTNYNLNSVVGEVSSSSAVGSASFNLRSGYLLESTPGTLPGTLQFSSATYSVAESGTTATIAVTRAGGNDGAASVDFTTSDGTAMAGSDYTAASGTLNWADGEAGDKTFTIPIINDGIDENNETVDLGLSNFATAAAGPQDTATLTITDDDVTYAPPHQTRQTHRIPQIHRILIRIIPLSKPLIRPIMPSIKRIQPIPLPLKHRNRLPQKSIRRSRRPMLRSSLPRS